MMTNRWMVLKPLSVRWVAVKAKIGMANASPFSVAAGITKSDPAVRATPKIAITTQKTDATIPRRSDSHATSPIRTSRTEAGVASIAW